MILYGLMIAILLILALKTPAAGVFSKDIVTVLKPFLAIGIVLHHFNGETLYMHEFERWGPLIVGIFFFISGYGLTYSLSRRPDYLKNFFSDKILLKLILPCILTLGISICLIYRNGYSFMEHLTNPEGPTFFPNDWFMYALIYCYLAFMVAGRAKSKAVMLSILVIAPLLFVLFTAAMGYLRNWWATPIAFSVGALYCSFEPQIRTFISGKKNYIYTTAVLLVTFGALMGMSMVFKSQVSTVLAYSLLPLLLVHVMIRLDVSRLARNRIILFLGSISLEIYLLHGIMMRFLSNIFPINGTILIICTLAVTIISAYLFKQLIAVCHKGAASIFPRLITA